MIISPGSSVSISGMTVSGTVILRPIGIGPSSISIIDAGSRARDRFVDVSKSVKDVRESWLVPAEVVANRNIMISTYDSLERLTEWEDNWDRHGAAKPDPLAIANANRWITSFFREMQCEDLPLLRPNVTANVEDEIVFSWRNGKRRATVYVTPETVEFVMSWGKDIYNEMIDGDGDSPEARRGLWQFLQQ